MSNPKFAIGESIILHSVGRSECNGEYIIERIIRKGDIYICRLTGNAITAKRVETYSYLLNTPFLHLDGYGEVHWAESSLRKKYPPSEFTFGELMNSLNKSNQLVK